MQMIRGRLCDDTKPETFNQLWSIEEQVVDISKLCKLINDLKYLVIRYLCKILFYVISLIMNLKYFNLSLPCIFVII